MALFAENTLFSSSERMEMLCLGVFALRQDTPQAAERGLSAGYK